MCPAWDPGTEKWNYLKAVHPDNIWASLNHDVPVLAHRLQQLCHMRIWIVNLNTHGITSGENWCGLCETAGLYL